MESIEIEYNGTIYRGNFTTEKGLVTVYYQGKTLVTQIGADKRMTARMLLRELVDATQIN
jgi:hypothetical protein